jgi:hypothetical protein
MEMEKPPSSGDCGITPDRVSREHSLDPSGHLIYTNRATLFAIPFDENLLETRGPAVPILDDVAYLGQSGNVDLSFAQTGALVYRRIGAADAAQMIQWVDATGTRRCPVGSGAGWQARGRHHTGCVRGSAEAGSRSGAPAQLLRRAAPPRAGEQVSAPQTIAHYRITAKLGEGGMGEVWRATDTRLGREVAIKILPASFARDPARMARFEREAKVLVPLFV